MNRLILALLAVCALCSGALARRASVGPVAIELPPPAGYCELDETNPSDARLFAVTQTASPATRLLAMSADCGQLRDWRAGRIPGLVNYAQYQTLRAWENAPLPVPPAQLIAQTCATLRAQGGDLASKERIGRPGTADAGDAGREAQPGEVHGRPGRGRQRLLRLAPGRVRTENGEEVEQATVFAVTIIRGKVIYYYLCAAFVGGHMITEMLARVRVHVAALEAANRN